jgi:hypothetical protein
MNENKIQPAVSDGSYECFWCEKKIWTAEGCVRIEFNVKIPIIGSTMKHEYAHPECADQVASLLHGSASESRAKNTKRRPR